MIKRILFAYLLIAGLSIQAVLADTPPAVSAEAAILMIAGDHTVLFDKQANAIMYPASTTKITTLITALEKGDLNSVVTVSPQAAQCEGSSLELRAGDKLTLKEALYGMMLVSGNDAAEAVAQSVGGSIPAFVAMMNDKAAEIGATRTHYTNPHGLPDPINHYTTAYDLALITSYAMKNPIFADIVSRRVYDVHFINRETVYVTTTNKFLSRYPGANGVKTGFTNDAGDCLVAAAKRGNVELIAVLLNDDYRWDDAVKLLDYGFEQLNVSK
ncbi:putative secreted protein [Propionispora sp. 2/2-37]|uniref:D-alanyl-D-alanine carboxypeptidase family protein n=1 Tax=Propionispora sp. 2/2-37 TaxID=1677858 RepID=UPI0006BB8B8D|nr:D-alanyl-D-alanine carboxypeptidase family protein [Propionispora sp. 2/2-37]CUH94822.1 putative secreted protein [Propionispora sp. 2/2-37]